MALIYDPDTVFAAFASGAKSHAITGITLQTGDLVVAAAVSYHGGRTWPTRTLGNRSMTWAPGNQANYGGILYRVVDGTEDDQVVRLALSGSDGNASPFKVWVFSGDWSAVDPDGLLMAPASSQTFALGPVTPDLDDNAVIAFVANRGSRTWTDDPDFTNSGTTPVTSQNWVTAHRIQTAATPQTYNYSTTDAATDSFGWIAVFNETVGGGGQSVSLPAIASATVTRPPVVAAEPLLQPPAIASTLVLRPPVLRYRVALPTVPTTAVLHTPVVAAEPLLVLPTRASTLVLRPPDLAYRVALPTRPAASSLNPPALTGQSGLSLPHLASSGSRNAPTVGYRVALPNVGATTIVRAPSIAAVYGLGLPHRASALSLYAPALAYRVALPHRASALALYPPALTPTGAVATPTIASGAAMYPPVLAYRLVGPTRASGLALYAPTLTTGTGLSLPHRASSLVLRPPVLSLGAPTLFLPTIGSGAQTFAPYIVGGSNPYDEVNTLVMPYGLDRVALSVPYAMRTRYRPGHWARTSVRIPR